MNPEQLDFARRLAAQPKFKALTGLPRFNDDRADNGVRFLDGEDVPDLTDAATGGVLWEVAGRPLIVGVGETGFISLEGPEVPEHGGAILMFGGDTLAEACARALLAEWEATPATPETTAS